MHQQLRLAKAEAHPIRFGMIEILLRETASPVEMGRELRVGLSPLSYHVKLLKDHGCIELVDTAMRRGAVEHYYRLSPEIVQRKLILELSPQQLELIAELVEDTLNDPGAPAYTEAERRELAAALEAFGGT